MLAVVLIVLPLTYITVVLGEITPKSLALRAPMSIVLKGAKWLSMADRLLSPVVSLLEWSTKKILAIFFRPPKKEDLPPPSTTIDLDVLGQAHQEAVFSFAHIERRKCFDFLVPWTTVTFARLEEKTEDVVSVVFASGHTRLPVTDGQEVIGILHTKEFLAYRENGGIDWPSIVRPALRVKSTETAFSILRRMQSGRSHMAIVFSPSGELLGIVTMEDILEEFLGEIYDEDEDSRIRKVFADKIKSKGPFT
jgi:putative hemolysin